jgi:hypothetical protein
VPSMRRWNFAAGIMSPVQLRLCHCPASGSIRFPRIRRCSRCGFFVSASTNAIIGIVPARGLTYAGLTIVVWSSGAIPETDSVAACTNTRVRRRPARGAGRCCPEDDSADADRDELPHYMSLPLCPSYNGSHGQPAKRSLPATRTSQSNLISRRNFSLQVLEHCQMHLDHHAGEDSLFSPRLSELYDPLRQEENNRCRQSRRPKPSLRERNRPYDAQPMYDRPP